MDAFEEIRENLRQTAALLAQNAKESAERQARHENEMAERQARHENEMAERQACYENEMAKRQIRHENEMAESHEQHKKELAERRAEDRERWARQDKWQAEMKEKIKSVGQQLGSIGMNNGAFAEDVFYNWLGETQTLGGEKYDIVERNIRERKGRSEFDIFMHNGVSSVIIEVKYRAHPNDIRKILTDKPAAFRRIYTEYSHHKLYLGLASLVINEDLKQMAQEAGIFLLGHKSTGYEVVNEKVQVF